MNEELKPCPFCGGDAELYVSRDCRDIGMTKISDKAQIRCVQCPASTIFKYTDADGAPLEIIIADTINNWNQRVEDGCGAGQ